MAAPTGAAAKALQDLWALTVAGVKQEATQPALFRAMEQSVVVTQEDGQFVIGFIGTDAQIGSILRTSQYQLQIERVLRRVSGDATLKLRVLDGSTYADWEHTKRRDTASLNRAQQTVQKQVIEATVSGSWEELYEQVSRLWANTENRTITFGKGRYLEASLTLVVEAMEKLYPKEGKADEPTERGLSRVLDRIANMSGSDPGMIAYLLIQRRK